jgi:hypothetical protein
MKIIGITGMAGSGKSTVAGILEDRFGFIEESFADPIRRFAVSLCCTSHTDLEKVKEQPIHGLCGVSPRVFMQKMGTEFGRDMISPDIWIRALESRMDRMRRFVDDFDPRRSSAAAEWWSPKLASGQLKIVVSDVRFANEAAWIRDHGELWHLARAGKSVQKHISESGVALTDRDRSLDNDCDLERLAARVAALIGGSP